MKRIATVSALVLAAGAGAVLLWLSGSGANGRGEAVGNTTRLAANAGGQTVTLSPRSDGQEPSAKTNHEAQATPHEAGDPGDGRDPASARRDVERLIRRTYAADSASELEDTVSTLGWRHPDAFAAMDIADTVCGIHGNATDAEPYRDRSAEHPPGSEQSLQFLSSYARRFCNDFSSETFARETQSYSEWVEDAMATASDPDTHRMLEIIDAEIRHRTPVGDARVSTRQALAGILARTQSPYVFKEAAARLVSGRYGEWDVGPALDRYADAVDPARVQDAGVMLAYCRMSGACGPNSLQSMQTCAPYLCRPGVTVRDVYAEMYSPFAIRLAESLARDILRYRRNHGSG